MENLNLKINGNEIKIKSKNKIEISEEIKTPQKLFFCLKNIETKLKTFQQEQKNLTKKS